MLRGAGLNTNSEADTLVQKLSLAGETSRTETRCSAESKLRRFYHNKATAMYLEVQYDILLSQCIAVQVRLLLPEGTVAILAGHDLGRGRLGVIPVGVRVAATILALRARERREVAARVDDDGNSLSGCPSVDVGKVRAPPRKERRVLEVEEKGTLSLPMSPGHLLRFYRRRKLRTRRVIVQHPPQRHCV